MLVWVVKGQPVKKRLKAPPSDLIGMDPILEIIRAAIWTGKIDVPKPVSIMLVSSQESGKTRAMKHFRGTVTLQYLSDLTANGILPYKNKIESKELRHFMLNDLTRILSHGRGVGERTLQSLATLMEEGESETSDPGGRLKWEGWPTVGVIMGITPEFYYKQRKQWKATGFATRFLPVSFRYTEATSKKILESIYKGTASNNAYPIVFPEKRNLQPIELSESFGKKLSESASKLATDYGIYGYRMLHALMSLAKGEAYSHGSTKVRKQDVEKVLQWVCYFEGEEVLL